MGVVISLPAENFSQIQPECRSFLVLQPAEIDLKLTRLPLWFLSQLGPWFLCESGSVWLRLEARTQPESPFQVRTCSLVMIFWGLLGYFLLLLEAGLFCFGHAKISTTFKRRSRWQVFFPGYCRFVAVFFPSLSKTKVLEMCPNAAFYCQTAPGGTTRAAPLGGGRTFVCPRLKRRPSFVAARNRATMFFFNIKYTWQAAFIWAATGSVRIQAMCCTYLIFL